MIPEPEPICAGSASDGDPKCGSVIPAALVAGLRSDLPGQIIAQVTEQIYDTPTGRSLLILIGAPLDQAPKPTFVLPIKTSVP
jgi:hypothetical protein